MNSTEKSRAGFIALVGAPNAGKSTLVNQLLGEQVSVVTRKAQTTRTSIKAILCHEQCQFIFVDTPGLFTPKDSFDHAMVDIALGTAAQADMIWLIIDAAQKDAKEKSCKYLEILAPILKQGSKKLAMILNKIDRLAPERLLPLADALYQHAQTHDREGDIFMVSALTGDGCERLLDFSANEMAESPFLYPEDQLTDMPMKLMAAEITRGTIFERVHQEVPYGIAVETTRWFVQSDDSIRIEQQIYVSRKSFKPILLGKKGETIKAISQKSRESIEAFMGKRVHLFLFVKHQENWRERKEFRIMQGMFDS